MAFNLGASHTSSISRLFQLFPYDADFPLDTSLVCLPAITRLATFSHYSRVCSRGKSPRKAPLFTLPTSIHHRSRGRKRFEEAHYVKTPFLGPFPVSATSINKVGRWTRATWESRSVRRIAWQRARNLFMRPCFNGIFILVTSTAMRMQYCLTATEKGLPWNPRQ